MHCKGLKIQFRRSTTVSQIRLERLQVNCGDVIAIVGPSGSGKTTLLKTLCGLIPQARPRGRWGKLYPFRLNDDITFTGSIAAADGRPLKGLTAYLPQDPVFFDGLSVVDNVALGEDVIEERSVLLTKLVPLLERLGLNHRIESDIRLLSGGEKQRVALARCFLHRSADLFCLDEPFAGLDGSSKRKSIEIIHEFARDQGKSFIIVTHELEDLFPFTSWVLLFERDRDRATEIRLVDAEEIRAARVARVVAEAVIDAGDSIEARRSDAPPGSHPLRLPVQRMVPSLEPMGDAIVARALGPRLEHRQLATFFVPKQVIQRDKQSWDIGPCSITIFCPDQFPRGTDVFLSDQI